MKVDRKTQLPSHQSLRHQNFKLEINSSGTRNKIKSTVLHNTIKMFTQNALLAALAATTANAHMFLATPVRFSTPAATNGPILAANFPCQSTGGSYAGETTSMALGSDQPLTFEGQSVHGGGSCQVSITYDTAPDQSSTWKVIKSIEGGCPARNTAGNLGSDTSATAADPFVYNFTIPDNIPSGKATLAWTWLNNVGNREFYMQCAGIELTGDGGEQSNYDALPDMFTANLDDSCTVETGDFVYPDPGSDVEYGNGEKPSGESLATTAGSCTVGVGGSGSGATSSAAAATSAAAPTTADSNPGGVFATSGASAPAVATTPATSETTAAPAAPSATGSSSSSSGSSSSSSSGTQSGACSDEGDYVCLGSTYQVCASGEWSVAMPLASGTTCTGTGANFEIAASKSKSRFRKSRAERRKRGMPLMFNMA